jgi:hypothetical protein
MLAPLLALAMMQSSELKNQDKGSSLLHACKAELRVIDSADGKGAEEDRMLAHVCFQYVQGFTDGSDLAGENICPGAATMGTIIRVYIAYMEKNPKLLEAYRGVGLHMAILDAYACPIKGK